MSELFRSTINDVARLSGVSIKTVSRVLNGGSQVSEKTKNRVLEAMNACSYQVNLFARGLKGARTNIIMHQQVEQERQDAVGKMISAFEAKYPYITVEPIAVDEDSFDTKVAALASAGTMPAICEFSQDQAKTYVTQQLIDTDACSEVIADQGEDSWFSGALNVIKTEDGSSYVGVPICGWVQGIWCNTAMLKEKGFSLPQSWDDVLKIAKAFNDPTNQTYGIALPTSDSAFTEQVFSQFALSNGANVFDADGKVTIDTDAMASAPSE